VGLAETILLVIFGIMLAAVSYVLFIPVNLQFSVIIEEKVTGFSSVKAFPFKRQLYPRPPKPEKAEKPKLAKEEKPEKEPKVEKKKKFDLSALNRSDIGMLLGVAGEAFKLLGRIFKAPDYYLVANLAGGAEEPDITGELFGAYHAVRPNLPAAVRISYVPDFLAGRFAGNISGGLVVTVFGLIKEVVIFIFRLPKIKLFKLYRKLKKGRTHVK
jgi:hypothetical protein